MLSVFINCTNKRKKQLKTTQGSKNIVVHHDAYAVF